MKNRKTQVIALVLSFTLVTGMFTACKSSNPTTPETSETTIESNEKTEAESIYETYDESVIMLGADNSAIYYSEDGEEAGNIEVGTEYEVIGENNESYFIKIDDVIYSVSKLALSEAEVEPTETDEETTSTSNTSTTPTSTPRPTSSGSTTPTTPETTVTYTCSVCGNVYHDEAAYTQHQRVTHTATPTTRPTVAPTTAPTNAPTATPTPTNVPVSVYPMEGHVWPVSGYATITFAYEWSDEEHPDGVHVSGVTYSEMPVVYSAGNWRLSATGDQMWSDNAHRDYPNMYWMSACTISNVHNVTWSDGVVTSGTSR